MLGPGTCHDNKTAQSAAMFIDIFGHLVPTSAQKRNDLNVRLTAAILFQGVAQRAREVMHTSTRNPKVPIVKQRTAWVLELAEHLETVDVSTVLAGLVASAIFLCDRVVSSLPLNSPHS